MIKVKVKARPKNNKKHSDPESTKYQQIVKKHPVEATSVTRQEKIKNDREKQVKKLTEKQMEKQSLLERIKQMVKKW